MKYIILTIICLLSVIGYSQSESAYRFFVKGNDCTKQEDYRGAINLYNLSIQIDKNPIAIHNRAKSYANLGILDSALIDFNYSISLDPQSKLSYLERGHLKKKIKNYIGAFDDFSKHLEVNGNNYKGFIARGDILIVQKKYEKAIIDLTQSIQLNSKQYLSFSNRGYAYIMIKEYDKAKKDLKQALKLNSKSQITHASMGKLFSYQKQYKKAIKSYKKAVKIKPLNGYYYQMALCQSILGDKKSAIKTLSIILENEEFPKCYFERGSYYGQLNKLDEALSDFNKGIELSPNSPKFYMNRTYYVWFPRKEFDKALDDMNYIINLDSTDAYAFSNRGYTYFGLKEYNKALKDVLKSISFDSRNSYAYKNLALIYFSLNEIEKSKIASRKAIKLKYPSGSDKEFKELLRVLGINP